MGLASMKTDVCILRCVGTGVTTTPDGRRISINVEVLGGSPMVQHYVEQITAEVAAQWSSCIRGHE